MKAEQEEVKRATAERLAKRNAEAQKKKEEQKEKVGRPCKTFYTNGSIMISSTAYLTFTLRHTPRSGWRGKLEREKPEKRRESRRKRKRRGNGRRRRRRRPRG